MRIVFLSQEYPPFGPAGGIGSYMSIIAPRLAERGHEVHALTCSGDESKDVVNDGVQVHVRPLRPIPGLRKLPHVSQTHARLAAARSAVRELRRLPSAHVVESPEWMAESLFVRGKRRREQLVVHLHSPVGLLALHGGRAGRDAALAHRLEMWSVAGAGAVSSPSQLLLDAVGCSGRVIRLPVDLDFWAPSPDVTTERVVVVAGRLERLKGLDVLVRALASLPDDLRDTRLVAAGSSSGTVEGRPYGEWLRDLADECGVPFEHRGRLGREELRALYREARLVAVPSHFDNFPMAALEAMASGRPVVCTNTCGTSELIRGTGAGAVVPPDDAAALGDALVPFLRDRELAASAGAAARVLVKSRCAPEVVTAERESLYADLAARAGRGR